MKSTDMKSIDNRTITASLINYLEGAVADEMILNSFIRDLEVIEANNERVVIKSSSTKGKEILDELYSAQIKNAVSQSFGDVPYEIVFGNNFSPTSEIKSENISPKFTFENYVVSDFNKEAVDMAQRIGNNIGMFSPLYINSRSGMGKTHLLHAIGNELTKKGYRSIYIEPNTFTGVIQSISMSKQYSKIADYINSFDQYDVLLFDDIQNLGDRSKTLDALLTIIKKNKDLDKQIVIVSDRVAQELSGFEPQFITRFGSGLTSTIKDPEIEDLVSVLKYRITSKGLDISKWAEDALEFIARNHSTSIRALEEGVNRVVFYTENDPNTQFDKTLMKLIFKDKMIDQSEITAERVQKVVAGEYKLTTKDLVGSVRKKEFVTARHVCIYLLHKMLHMTQSEIAKIMGNKHHTTIGHALSNIEKDMVTNKSVKVAISRLEGKIKSVS